MSTLVVSATKATGGKASTKQGKVKQATKQPQVKGEVVAEKLSALAAAAKVLGETGRAMNCQEMIEAMAAKGYWTSPAGMTPASTLYAAIQKEVATKGKEARFVKVARGQFARGGS